MQILKGCPQWAAFFVTAKNGTTFRINLSGLINLLYSLIKEAVHNFGQPFFIIFN